MPQSNKSYLGTRLYPYSEDTTWRFPKHKSLPVIRHTLGYINSYFASYDKWPTIEIFNGALNSYLEGFSDILRREGSKKLDSAKLKLAEVIFLGLCSITESQEETKRFIFPSKLGLLFCDVYDNCLRSNSNKEEHNFLSFLCFLMLKQASFSSGCTDTSMLIDEIHPYEIVFNYFSRGIKITSADLCEKFYGDDPKIDFLNPSRPPRLLPEEQEDVNAYWEYFVGHGFIFKLFAFTDSSGKRANRKKMRRYQPDLYQKNLFLAPTSLLLSFLDPEQGKYWNAVYESRAAAFEADAYAFSDTRPDYVNDVFPPFSSSSTAPLVKITRLVTARNGQQSFRNSVLSEWGEKCLICDISAKVLLEAAHILPHYLCSSQQEARDPGNGVTLCKNHHKAYDEGLLHLTLSYSADHQLELSCVSDENVVDLAFVSTLSNRKITLPNSKSVLYLKKRAAVFKK